LSGRILPWIFAVISHTYPKSYFFRAMFPETIEIGFNCHLFGWWQTFPKNVLFDER
jgi:hypothetical protein